jgi:two-component system chemotaxis sensor kinase CheA
MASLDQLKATFFDECSEALQQIEAGLTDLREGAASEDTINAVFRSVHSVKGGAGIFGFDGLVGFAHVFETVLDAMRSGKLAATPDVVDVLLPANDVLSDLIAMSRSGEAIPPDLGHESRAALEQLLGAGGDGADDLSPAPADFEGIDFAPVPIDDFDAGGDDGSEQTYRIVFRPKPEMLKKANEPLYIVRELRKLGALDLVAELDRLPSLDQLEYDHPYLGWTGTLRTAAKREQIDEVFEFVTGDCEIEITKDGPPEIADPPGEIVEAVSPPIQPAVPSVAADLRGEPAAPSAATHPEIESIGTATARPATVKVPAAGATTTRVELEKIDRVVNMVGELVIAQAMLGQVVHGLPEDVSGRLTQVLEEVVHRTRELKDSVMSMRAQPVNAVFQRMPRLVRELATKTSKKVRLELSGENTEVDRSIIERLGDPLTHIIRNSIDHGIELPADRLAARKAEEGTIRLAAEHRGGRIVIRSATMAPASIPSASSKRRGIRD